MQASAPSPEHAHRQWHQERLRALQAPDGWLTLVDLHWLQDGRHTVGTTPGSTIRLPGAGRCPDHWGELQVSGLSATWTDAQGRTAPFHTDRDPQPTCIQHGPISLLLLERDGTLALRVKDTQAQTRTGFRGTELFDFSPAWQISAHWDGERAHCELDGCPYALVPMHPAADPLHFVIGDATSGNLTYGGGRFLYLPRPPRAPGPLQLDLNRCINPPCAFTPYATCPVPPPENRLHVAVLAGEKAYADHG